MRWIHVYFKIQTFNKYRCFPNFIQMFLLISNMGSLCVKTVIPLARGVICRIKHAQFETDVISHLWRHNLIIIHWVNWFVVSESCGLSFSSAITYLIYYQKRLKKHILQCPESKPWIDIMVRILIEDLKYICMRTLKSSLSIK
jgi:hypothetical protein